MTSLDKRLYQALTEATDAVAGAAGERPNERLDDLLRDPDTRRCWREVVTGEDPLTLRGGRRPRTVILSGGSFQNLRLLASARRRLEGLGFRVLAHSLVPPNDAGISYGQAAVAAATLARSREGEHASDARSS